MRLSRAMQIGCLLIGPVFVNQAAFAQFPIKFPGKRPDTPAKRKGDDGQSNAKGVPISPDSPIFLAFGQLEKQTVYHQRMTLDVSDPMMQEMLAKAGMTPAETITSPDAKRVSMHMKMPVHGAPVDFELVTVLSNGRMAKKWISPASAQIVAEADEKLAKSLLQQEESTAKSVARNIAMGPMGLVSSAVSAAGAAASAVAAARTSKTIHDFFEWTCMDSAVATSPSQRLAPPPLTDLRVLGSQSVEGVDAAGYEFFVHQDGRFQGPLQMYVAKETGLPLRIAMSDPHAGGSMHMDYYGFNQGGDFEIPACVAQHK